MPENPTPDRHGRIETHDVHLGCVPGTLKQLVPGRMHAKTPHPLDVPFPPVGIQTTRDAL
jgi:hypothetical protein